MGPRAWEEIEEHLVSDLISAGTNSIDVGANTGSYARCMAIYSQKVHAIEPVPELVEQLKLLRMSNIVIHENVASADEAEMELRIPGAAGGSSLGLGTLQHTALDPEADFRTLSVNSIMLDRFAGEGISFVKIDVEGHEMGVLSGARRLIDSDRPNFLIEIEERHRTGAVEEVSAFMREFDYQCFFCHQGLVRPLAEITPEMLNDESLSWNVSRVKMPYVNNFLFIPSERVAQIVPELRRSLHRISKRYSISSSDPSH